MERSSQAGQAVLLFFRYAAAVVVACIAACLVFTISVIGTTAAGFLEIGFIIPVILAGFTGVFAGAFCLPRQRQLAGSIVLVAFAVGLGLSQILGSKYQIWDVAVFVHLLFFAGGGAVALVFFFVRRCKNQVTNEPMLPPAKLAGPFDATPSE